MYDAGNSNNTIRSQQRARPLNERNQRATLSRAFCCMHIQQKETVVNTIHKSHVQYTKLMLTYLTLCTMSKYM